MADTLATLIPVEREIAFGKTVVAQMESALGAADMGALRCTGPEGRAALDAMLTRLSGGQALQYDLEVQVFDHKMVNAFAAPGGQIVVMRGLLDSATGPDAVASVLAHGDRPCGRARRDTPCPARRRIGGAFVDGAGRCDGRNAGRVSGRAG